MAAAMVDDSIKGSPRYQLGEMRASAPAMGKIYELLAKLAPASTPILIEGETGTGKQTLAWTVHNLSTARQATCIRCTGLSETEFQVELDAGSRPKGLPGRLAPRSLILLDVAALSAQSQALLIARLGPDVTFHRGAVTPAPGPRLICTSAVDLGRMVQRGRFRADLYYRLNGACVKIPPLRHRPGDVDLIAGSFLGHRLPLKAMTPDAKSLLTAYSWPGNVRQLMQVLEAAATDAADQPFITEKSLTRFMTGVVPSSDIMLPLGTTLAAAERLVIQATLAAHGGNRQETAKTLGIARRTLYEKLRAGRENVGRRLGLEGAGQPAGGEKGEPRCTLEH